MPSDLEYRLAGGRGRGGCRPAERPRRRRGRAALTKVWPEPLAASPEEAARYRGWWEARGIRIVALQALLYGKPGLTVFGTPAARRTTLHYLKGLIAQATRLGAEVLVFGSPGNRQRGSLPPDEARAIAVEFFRELGDNAQEHGVTFCIEPNPVEYGCDFVTTVREGIDLVDAVGRPGFGLHLDTAGMTLAGDTAASVAAAGKCCPALPRQHAFSGRRPRRRGGPRRLRRGPAASGLSRLGVHRNERGEAGAELASSRAAGAGLRSRCVPSCTRCG